MNQIRQSRYFRAVFDLAEELRLDRFLAEIRDDLSRSRISNLIRSGDITLNGKETKPSATLQ